MPYILKVYGISNTQSSSILLTRSLFGFLATAVSGWYYRTFSLRSGMLIAGLSTVLGYVLFGFSSGYLTILAGSALVGIGFGLGATPNAMANMSAVCFKYRHTVRPFVIVPIIGAMFVDLINTAVITLFLNLL